MTSRDLYNLKINDVTMRDGHQSLIATRMLIDDLVEQARIADKVGYSSLEVWGGATFDTAMRYKGENPWDNLRKLRDAAPHTSLSMLLRGQNLVGYKNYPDNVVENFVYKTADSGMNIVRIFDSLNYLPNMQSSFDAVMNRQARGYDISPQGTVCYTTSPVHNIEGFVELASEIEKIGYESLCIKDMAGLMTPDVAREMIPAIKSEIKIPVVLHMHAGMGLSDATLIAAIESGVDEIDTASRAMSGCYGHTSIETLIDMLGCEASDLGLNEPNMRMMEKTVATQRVKYEAFEAKHDPEKVELIYEAQVPGGMMSNFENQIKGQLPKDVASCPIGYGEVLKGSLAEFPQVRKDFGYPPLVTPSSQIVGVQSFFNYQSKRMGDAEYSSMPEDSKALLLGELGQTIADPAPHVLAIAEKTSGKTRIDHRYADTLPSAKLDGEMGSALIKELWGAMGKSFLQTGEKQDKKAPVPGMPSYLASKANTNGWNGGNGSTIPYIGSREVAECVGLHNIEGIVQASLELTTLKDGTIKELSDEMMEMRVDNVNTRIKCLLDECAERIARSDFSTGQKMGAANILNNIVKLRASVFGVPDSNLPSVTVAQVMDVADSLKRSNPRSTGAGIETNAARMLKAQRL
jgi:pyruvate/oxaloacetate carboxyltransferase